MKNLKWYIFLIGLLISTTGGLMKILKFDFSNSLLTIGTIGIVSGLILIIKDLVFRSKIM